MALKNWENENLFLYNWNLTVQRTVIIFAPQIET